MQESVSDSKELLLKLQRYCAYQERSFHDVKKKLNDLEASDSDARYVMERLEDENFLNQNRFAEVFVSGKFRIKKWGRQKIREGLRQHHVQKELIDSAIKGIDELEYRKTLKQLLLKKNKELIGKDNMQSRLYRYAGSKGFEYNYIKELLTEILKG